MCQIICLFMYFYYFQKSRNVMFSGTEPDYLFIYVFILFPEVQKCCFRALCQIICLFIYLYYFQKSGNVMFSGAVHFARQVYVSFWNRHHNVLNKYKYCFTQLYIKIYGRSNCLAMNRVGYFRITLSWYHRYDGHNCIVVASTPESYAIILSSLNVAKCPPFWSYGNGHPTLRLKFKKWKSIIGPL